MPDVQTEMSPSEKAQIALRRADEAKKPIDRADTWNGTISRIKWVMDTVSPITEVRAVFILPLLDWADFCSQLHPFAKMAYDLVSVIPGVRLFALMSEGKHLHYVYPGARHSKNSTNATTAC